MRAKLYGVLSVQLPSKNWLLIKRNKGCQRTDDGYTFALDRLEKANQLEEAEEKAIEQKNTAGD